MPAATPLRVLLCEDVEDDALLVLRALRAGGFNPTWRRVQTAREMSAALFEHGWDVVLSDYSMPGFEAPQALRILQDGGFDLPFIIISGTIGEDTAVQAMKAGAHDYLVKGQLARLVPAVQRELRESVQRADRRKAEAALRLSDERARLVGRATNDVIWDWDIEADQLWLGDAVRRGYGWDVESVKIEYWIERLHPDNQSRVVDGLYGALRRGATSHWDEYRWRRADGGYAAIFDRGYVMYGEGGAAKRMIGSMMNVSERKRMEETLRASEERFRTLVGSLDDLVFTVDQDLLINGIFGRWFEHNRVRAAEIMGRRPSDLLGEHGEGHEAAFGRVLAGGEHLSYEYPSSDGQRHFLLSLSPLHDAAGNVSGVVGLGRDVTEQKRVQEQLLLSDRMVSVGTLAAGVAHEINNPLAAVAANLDYALRELTEARAAELVRDDGSPGQRRLGLLSRMGEIEEPLREARSAADRVRQLVRDLKVFSRSDSTEEKRVLVDVERVLESSLRMAWNEIRHRAQLVKELSGVPPVDANESRLGQVFLNLIVNAAQAIREGAAERNLIRVATRRVDDRVVIEIQDSGEGMPPEVLRKLFTPFFTTKPVGSGTGLGLSISHRIVTGLGGTIEVESTPGVGTTFRVALPMADLEPIERMPPTPPPVPLRRGRLLIIDDEPLVASALERTLARDHDVTVVRRANEALELLRAGTAFDVILCNLMMPDMTGMDLHDTLSREAPALAQRMVFVTGGAFTPAARAFLERAPNPRLEKPFDAKQLLKMVNEQLR